MRPVVKKRRLYFTMVHHPLGAKRAMTNEPQVALTTPPITHVWATTYESEFEQQALSHTGKQMTPEQLSALRTELQTQDNACTEHPLFCVFQKQRIYGLDFDHAEHFVWLTPDDGDGRRETDEDAPGAERVGYVDVDRFVTACLTRKAALAFIERQSHRLREPFLYVESLHRNEEMISIREHLMMEPA